MKNFIALLTAGLAFVSSAGAQSPAETMHDTYCVVCHGTEVYTKDMRLANDYKSLRAQVDLWQTNLSLNWSNAEIDTMTAWLAQRYYGLTCSAEC